MKEYEAIHEILNNCPMNHGRDRFFEEIETDDPEQWILQKFRDRDLQYEKTVKPDGSICFEIFTSGIHQRYTFTEA